MPELVRLELLYGIARRAAEHIATGAGDMRALADQLRAAAVGSVTDFALSSFEGNETSARFAAFVVDRVRLAYSDADLERHSDIWDLRLFGASGHLDFTLIRQDWLREATKAWAATAMAGVRSVSTIQDQVRAVVTLSSVLASGPGGGHDPTALGRADIDRFLVRRGSLKTNQGRPYSARRAAAIVENGALVIREAREMGLVPHLPSTFAFRRGDAGRRADNDDDVGRALPDPVVACLDGQLDLLRGVPATSRGQPGGDWAWWVNGPGNGRLDLSPAQRHRAARRRGGQPAPQLPRRRRARAASADLGQPQGRADGPAPAHLGLRTSGRHPPATDLGGRTLSRHPS